MNTFLYLSGVNTDIKKQMKIKTHLWRASEKYEHSDVLRRCSKNLFINKIIQLYIGVFID